MIPEVKANENDRQSCSFQGWLFGDDAESRAQHSARLLACEKNLAYAEARRLAWYAGKPFPEDQAKWAVTHREIVNARCREAYRDSYSAIAEYYLQSASCYRAEQYGCKIGRRRPILRVYRRAVHMPILLCYWCKSVTRPGERHVDHKQPLVAGGAHTAGNLCITCTDCNLSKGSKNPAEFRNVVAGKRSANSLIAATFFRQERNALRK